MKDYDDLTSKQKLRYDKILYFAEEWICEHGFYKMSLDDLTKQLKISRSTIYENFGSKEGLVEKVVEVFGKQLDQDLEEILSDNKLSTYEKFLAVASKQGNALEGKHCYNFMNDLKIHTPHLNKKYEKGRKNRILKYYKPLIDQGIKEGFFDKKLKPDFLLQVYLKICLLYTSPSPRDATLSRMPSSA